MQVSPRRGAGARSRSAGYLSWSAFEGERARFGMFCLLVIGVFLLGGGSRADILSLALLRPLAVLVGAYALIVAEPAQLRPVRWPLAILGLLALLMLAQLVPLPQGWWAALPERSLIVQIQRDAGMPDVYRPLTLSPSRTLNALLSLGVPFATLLIVSVQPVDARRKILFVIAIAAAASVIWAVAQVGGPPRGPLYTYKITNNGFPVGPFANRNHLALLLAILVVLIGYIYRRLVLQGPVRFLFSAGLAVAALVVLGLVIVAGSRAGLVLAATALLAASWLAFDAYKQMHGIPGKKAKLIFAGGLAVAVAIIAAIAIGSSQAASIERLSAGDALADVRAGSWPLVVEMLKQHWMAGIGFGAFESVFKAHETSAVLSPFIFNQAHNDWLQFPMEGGLPAIALLAASLAWIAAQSADVLKSRRGGAFLASRFVAVAILGMCALASIVDYPLRTPIMMFICATSISLLSRPKSEPNP